MAISLIILAAPANVTYVTGHLTIALRNFPCHPIKLSNGMSVHHIRYCYHHTSIWFYRRGERSFRGHRRNLFHEQLKLAGAARGLPGDRCPSRRSFFAYQYNCPFARQASGHEPGRSSRNRSHQNLRSETVKTRRYKKTYSHRKTAKHTVIGSPSACDGWVPYLLVPCIRCNLAAFPKAPLPSTLS